VYNVDYFVLLINELSIDPEGAVRGIQTERCSFDSWLDTKA
jgi:hypothetical protein